MMMLMMIKKVFRRLEDERLTQLQAMAALYLQVIAFMMMMMVMLIIVNIKIININIMLTR